MKLSRIDKELIRLKEKVEMKATKNSNERLKKLLDNIKSTNLCAKLRSPSKTCHNSSVQI